MYTDLIFALEDKHVGDPAEGYPKMDDFSLGDLIWDVAYVDHLRGLLVLSVQFHLRTRTCKRLNQIHQHETRKKLFARADAGRKNDYEDGEEAAAAFHFALKGLRLFFFEPARLDGAAATDLCLSFSDDAPA